MTVRSKDKLLRHALEQHRLARGAARDAAEGVDHMAALAIRALEQPRFATRLLRVIAATAENTLDALEDSGAAYAESRIVFQLLLRPKGMRRR